MENIERLSTFHDAELRHVSHKAAVELLELGFEKADGQFVLISLCGVVAFRATDMKMQSVVSRLLVHGINITLTEADLVEHVGWISRTCDGEQLSDSKAVNTLVQKVIAGKRQLFILEPSWGAEMVVLAEKILL